MKNCLECQEKIVGRDDKKFCCDACRNTYNNRMNRDLTCFMRNVNNKLRRNHRILSELNPTGTFKTPRRTLADRGFDFSYFTNIKRTRSGTYFFLYDQGYRELDGRFCLLVKKPD